MMHTTETSLSYLKKKVEKLLKDIQEIKEEDKIIRSNKIMERLRGETIFLPKSYVKDKEKDKTCTIDPSRCLQIDLAQIENGNNCDSIARYLKDGIVTLKANTFGPYVPEEYFKEDTFRIVWLLKESYITSSSYEAGDRGFHNQAAEYVQYFVSNLNLGNATHDNILLLSQSMLRPLYEMSKKDIEELSNEKLKDRLYSLKEEDINNNLNILKHICIIEINHYPGFYFNSWDTDDTCLKKWAEVNMELIKLLCDFNKPDIIVLGGVHECFHDNSNFDKIRKNVKNGTLLKQFGVAPNPLCANNKYITGTQNYIIPTEDDGPIFIQADHPCYPGYTTNRAKNDGIRIIDWFKSINK